jgi:hypothetical protein
MHWGAQRSDGLYVSQSQNWNACLDCALREAGRNFLKKVSSLAFFQKLFGY